MKKNNWKNNNIKQQLAAKFKIYMYPIIKNKINLNNQKKINFL
jgi:hypothetical protein